MCKFLLATTFVLFSISCVAGDAVTIDYNYTKNHGVDFSTSSRGSLKIENFTDQRGQEADLITEILKGDNVERYKAQHALASIFQDAFIQAFEKGNAKLVESGETLRLLGEIVEVKGNVKGEGIESKIELTVRLKIALFNTNNNKKLWENTLFSKASSSQSEGIGAALTIVMDKLIEELMYDDYFLIEIAG